MSLVLVVQAKNIKGVVVIDLTVSFLDISLGL